MITLNTNFCEYAILMGVRRAFPVLGLFVVLLGSPLTMNSVYSVSDGTVDSEEKISDTQGNFEGGLGPSDNFGASVTNMGDLNGDGVNDLAVGTPLDGGCCDFKGAVWILFLKSDGTVDSEQKISESAGNFGGILENGDQFGTSVANLGDLNGDGVNDLAVGSVGDQDGGSLRGAVWILFLKSDGTVDSEQKISDTAGNFGGLLDEGDVFGEEVANLGDLNGDGVNDLAVGAVGDDDGATQTGAVWILFLKSDGTVDSSLPNNGFQKISDTAGNFGGALSSFDFFGKSITNMGDLNGNGVNDIAVGAPSDDDGGPFRGAVWILFLKSDGTVDSSLPNNGFQKISDTAGNFGGLLDDFDQIGQSTANLGDLNGDGVNDLAVGTPVDDDGGPFRGVVWILFLKSDGTVDSEQKISDTAGNFGGLLDDFDGFGVSVANMGDLNGDGVNDLAVGSRGDDDGGEASGAVWILFLKNTNNPPDCSGVVPESTNSISSFDSAIVTTSSSSPSNINKEGSPSHKIVEITLGGVTDPDGDPTTLTVDGITQDEPTNGLGDGDQSPDGFGVGTDTPHVRVERAGIGDGRVYEISFTADDGNGGSCSGSVSFAVPHDKGKDAVDSGQNFDSTQP